MPLLGRSELGLESRRRVRRAFQRPIRVVQVAVQPLVLSLGSLQLPPELYMLLIHLFQLERAGLHHIPPGVDLLAIKGNLELKVPARVSHG